ncbi:hypothetical protein GCM10027277_34330 [Pseudoduganella ginsengisoli]|nr:prenyltransferase/squalene oxidase repeat-containing protein [Pseudoduganella ginsengisoli]
MNEKLVQLWQRLLDSVLDPIAEWVHKLSWAKRASIVLAGAAAAMLEQNPDILSKGWTFSGRVIRVAMAAPDVIPLTSEMQVTVLDIQDRLHTVNQNDTHLIPTLGLTGWSASQTLLSIAELRNSQQGAQLTGYIRARRLAPCNCWAELNDDKENKGWTFITGWVLAALAAHGTEAEPVEIEFLLNHQNADGSWSSIPDKTLPQYASVYATAWATLGLLKQSNAALIKDTAMAKSASDAASRGAAWLLNVRQPKARWKPYPYQTASSISGSISGLAMHTLHEAMPRQVSSLEQDWLENIPESPVPASLGENSYVEIKSSETRQIDHFVQLTMPWMLMATVEAYPHGTIQQKIRALSWIEQTLAHESVRNADTEQGNWWRAELGIAINHLVRHLPAGAQQAGRDNRK